MKTNKKSISLLLALVMFLSAFALSGTYAENEIVEDEFIEDLPVEEEKIFCQATLEDDFADDRVTVVLKNKASRLLLDYDKSSFPEIECTDVSDLTHYTKDILKDPTKNDGEMAQMLDINKYHQILRIDLPVHSKENVLEVIHI
ncbi:MAG: hypothetical protein IKS28_00375, partial [Clostridia bacterium]|nr:hypothetical protein [Clostridia bacterium]